MVSQIISRTEETLQHGKYNKTVVQNMLRMCEAEQVFKKIEIVQIWASVDLRNHLSKSNYLFHSARAHHILNYHL